MRRRWKRAAAAAVVALAATLAMMVWAVPFMARDACLDGGGAWLDDRCVH